MTERFLLDTHTFLWLASTPGKVPASVRERLAVAPVVALSTVSAWEIAIKYGLGRLPLPQPPATWLPGRRLAMGVEALAFEERHAVATAHLADHHRDPFDRALVAIAASDGWTLVSRDPRVRAYGVDTLWD